MTCYWFCKGFVTHQDQKRREYTVWAFLFAVISQEITMVMGPLLVLGFLLFARDLRTSPQPATPHRRRNRDGLDFH